jgi:hypothetical protein
MKKKIIAPQWKFQRRASASNKTSRKQATPARVKTPPVPRKILLRERPEVFVRLLVFLLISSLAFWGINDGWLNTTNVNVTGNMQFSDDEIIALAGLDNVEEIWAVAIPRNDVKARLEENPLIDQVQVALTGPCSLQIKVTERHSIAAIEKNGYKFLFDRTATLTEILRPDAICSYPLVWEVPPGLLKYRGTPLCTQSNAWSLPLGSPDLETMNQQFNRLINLRFLLDRYASDRENDLKGIWMDNLGRLRVEYLGYPPVLLGRFDSSDPDLHVRRMLAALDNSDINDFRKTISIDLSYSEFPCYYVNEQFYSDFEKRFVEQLNAGAIANAALPQPDTTDGAVQDEPEPVDAGKPAFDPDFFNLAGGA